MGNPRYESYPEGFVFGRGEIDLENEKSLFTFRLQKFLENVPAKKGKLLEIGCGGGQFLRTIEKLRPDLTLVGCDIDSPAIKENNKQAKKNKSKVKYVYADIMDLPFKKNEFDVVMIFDVIEHVKPTSKALSEIKRVLKPGGIFHVNAPCEVNPGTWHWMLNSLGIEGGVTEKHAGHIVKFSFKSLRTALKRSGFKILNEEYSDYYFQQLAGWFFFFLIGATGKGDEFWSAQSRTAVKNESTVTKLVRKIKEISYAMSYYEAKFLNDVLKTRMGAMAIHLTCRNGKKN